jgi:hypothetical protein
MQIEKPQRADKEYYGKICMIIEQMESENCSNVQIARAAGVDETTIRALIAIMNTMVKCKTFGEWQSKYRGKIRANRAASVWRCIFGGEADEDAFYGELPELDAEERQSVYEDCLYRATLRMESQTCEL